MRTTGVRSAPLPVPRPKPAPDTPQPLPRTRFLEKSASEEVPPQATQRSPSTSPVQSRCISPQTPPPKPPRTPSLSGSPRECAFPGPRRPGLMEVLSRPIPDPTNSPASTAQQSAPVLRPARPAPLGKVAGSKTRHGSRSRPQPLSLPPLPATPPPKVPANTAVPRVPSRPSAIQLAALRPPTRAPDPRPGSLPLAVGLRTDSRLQSPVCSTEDFEDSCKEVFRNVKTAKELSARGKHMQAASHYQVALTALDRVIRAHVLTLSQDEPTRQRLFLLQQEVFSFRKVALNGFADSQTAVRTPRGLSPPTATPGAPPSYDDVLKEDSRRRRDDPARSSRQPPTQGPASSLNHPPPPGRSTRPRPCPAPPQPPPTHRPSTRTRSHSSSETRVEELVDVRGARSREVTTAPPTTQPHSFKATSATRPKSYHPLIQLDPPLSLPPAAGCRNSLPPPLLPLSLPPASLPTQHSGATSMEPRPQPVPNPVPLLDEAVLYQMRVLQVYERDKCLDTLADTPASHPQKEPLPLSTGNLQERKGKARAASNSSDKPLPESTMKASTVQVKDEGKNDPVPFRSSVDDPFLRLDPFLPIKPQSGDNDMVFPEVTQGLHTSPAASGTRQTHSHVNSGEVSLTARQKDSPNPEKMQESNGPSVMSPAENLGDSILEALDFAITPVSGARRTSSQYSRDRRTARSVSEENLLDSSPNTLDAILHPTKDRHASRASIIEEFDPLVTCQAPQDDEQDDGVQGQVCGQKNKPREEEESEVPSSSPPKPAPRKILKSSLASDEDSMAAKREMDAHDAPPHYYAEGGAVALEEKGGMDDYNKRYPGAHCLPDGGKGKASYPSSEASSSVYSWPPDYTSTPLPTTASPLYPSLYQEEVKEEEEGASVDIGRSAFYLHPKTQGVAKRRDLLNIREGVKIYFICADSVVTSPWNKPFLAVSRDPSKDKLFGSGLVLSVGNNLWMCELHRKSTLVLRTQLGSYVFSEVAGRPECKAVAIRVPSGVRRAQQELLSNILQQNTLMEDERPKGITKVISKGATSAATRMSKIVDDQTMTPSQTFVRRNSIRALKGVRKRLNNIAEKTGGTLKELPEEYQGLQEAADTLAFAHSAKMIQYI